MIKRETWALVIPISILPAIWCVAAMLTGVGPAAAAMISATLYVILVKSVADALKMSLSFVLGVVEAVISIMIVGALSAAIPMIAALPLTMIVMVALVIIIQTFIVKWTDLFSMLCGFAVSMTVLTMVDPSAMMGMAVQLAVAMLVGIWWIGFVGTRIMGAIMAGGKK